MSEGQRIRIHIKGFLKTFLFGLFPPVALILLGTPYGWLTLLLSLLKVIPMAVGVAHFIFSIIARIVNIIILNLNARNTFCCATNKRVKKEAEPSITNLFTIP